MNFLDGEDFELLRLRAINLYGAKGLQYSQRSNKKYVVTLKNGDQIHFGHPDYEDFLIHKDKVRRLRYRKRASKIRDENGNLTYKDKNSPNYWSYNLLW